MDYSLPAWLGALAGTVLAVAIYAPGIRLIDRHMRTQNGPISAERREGFEQRLSILRRLILALDIAILATVGYWIGKALAGPGGISAFH